MLRLALRAATLIAADSVSLSEGGREEVRPWNWHGHLYCRIVCAACVIMCTKQCGNGILEKDVSLDTKVETFIIIRCGGRAI